MLQKSDLEEGMSYYVMQHTNSYVFKYLKDDVENKYGKNNIIASVAVGINNNHFSTGEVAVTVGDYELRKATVVEDVILEESLRESRRMDEEEAVSTFEKRMEIK